MQYLKEEVKKRIMSAALKEFEQKGYQKASMSKISSDAKVAIGNIYRYFKNKDELFNELMEPVNNQLLIRVFNKYRIDSTNKNTDFQLEDVINEIVGFYSMHRTELIILMEKSEGSKYQNLKNDFINLVYQMDKNEYLNLAKENKIELSDIILFVISKSLFESLFTIFKEVDNVEDVKKEVTLLVKFFYNGFIERFK